MGKNRCLLEGGSFEPPWMTVLQMSQHFPLLRRGSNIGRVKNTPAEITAQAIFFEFLYNSIIAELFNIVPQTGLAPHEFQFR